MRIRKIFCNFAPKYSIVDKFRKKMRKPCLTKGMAAIAFGLTIASCSSDITNENRILTEEEAFENAEAQLGITIDPNQTWLMTKDVNGTVGVKLGTNDDYTLIVFDKNPFVYNDAVFFLRQTVKDGSETTFSVSVPTEQEQLYITLLADNGYSMSRYKLITDKNTFSTEFTTEAANAPRRANTGETYNATSTGINANANEWADPTENKTYGGWVVPPALTADQKAVVKAYFQQNKDLRYTDPEWRHFFVQQVYTGGSSAGTLGNKEDNTAADGRHYSSDNMNELSVGYNNQIINNFNKADATSVGVLDSAYTANDFDNHKHSDQIMLMVNIDDTRCMGYKNSACNARRNDKAALADWSTIRTWANANGLNGNCLNDGWNRSFVGFDFELLSKDDSYVKDNGTIVNAKFTDGQNSGLPYVWDGSKAIPMKTVTPLADLDLFDRFKNNAYYWSNDDGYQTSYVDTQTGFLVYKAKEWGGIAIWENDMSIFKDYSKLVVEFAEETTTITKLCVGNQSVEAQAGALRLEFDMENKSWLFTGSNQIAIQAGANTTLKIGAIYMEGREGVNGYGNYLLVNGKKVPMLSSNTNQYGGTKTSISDNDMKINKEGYGDCFNMPKIAQMVNDGYLPVQNTNLRDWVKWSGGDGYFSDWIVTLTKAERLPTTDTHQDPPAQNSNIYSYAFEDTNGGDYDMNDVVIKAQETTDGTKINLTLVAVGATLDLNIRLYPDQGTRLESEVAHYEGTPRDLTYNNKTEVHEMLGVDIKGVMVNTDAEGGATARPITIQIDKGNYDPAHLPLAIYSTAQGEMKLARTGRPPYGIIVPGDWSWPKEQIRVTNAYGNTSTSEGDQSFSTFGETTNQASNWYKYPTASLVMNEASLQF